MEHGRNIQHLSDKNMKHVTCKHNSSKQKSLSILKKKSWKLYTFLKRNKRNDHTTPGFMHQKFKDSWVVGVIAWPVKNS